MRSRGGYEAGGTPVSELPPPPASVTVYRGEPESTWTQPSEWCLHPEHWHSDDVMGTEHEVTELVAAFARALQPEVCVETGTWAGQTAEAIGHALAANGHGVLYTLEASPDLAASAAVRCEGLPVEVIAQPSLTWEPPEPIGFAWLDSSIGDRALELAKWRHHFAPGAVVGIHDTAPHHQTMPLMAPVLAQGWLQVITLRTPRGVTFATVTDPKGM